MHPLLADRKRLALYLLGWSMLAVLLALLVMEPGRAGVRAALMLALPPVLVYAFVCLAAWYPTRAMPPERARMLPLLVTHLLAAAAMSVLWLMLFRAWAAAVDALRGTAFTDVIVSRSLVLLVAGVLLYLLAVAFHYVLLGIERELDIRTLARDAELKALKAQLDPHFLFNSLNAISSLCGSNPLSARTLTTLLAEYLRKSLRVGSAEAITLSEELELASSYLAIERVRFGPRLELEQQIDESVRDVRVPPLLLQPLVENAVTHGVAQLLEGGVVRIEARPEGESHVHIAVENRCDPDRPPRQGHGIGLTNTRRRLGAFYSGAAKLTVVDEPTRFRVDLVVPR
ncbi:MAG TPA: histidine kinase [Thermoanaerobaculia bacterium]|jgi:hypothetical protein